MRIWIKGDLCIDREPIQDYIMDLEKQLAEKDKEIERLNKLLSTAQSLCAKAISAYAGKVANQ